MHVYRFLKFVPHPSPPLRFRLPQTVSSLPARLFLMEVWLNPVCAASTKQPPRLTLHSFLFLPFSDHKACFISMLQPGFFLLRNEKENKNKQTSGNAQMCRCANRLGSSAVVVLGCLRGKAKQNNKGHQLHAMGHQCTGGTILEFRLLQSSSEQVWHHHFNVQLIGEGIQRRLPPGGAQTYF